MKILYCKHGLEIVLLLVGGDKSTQSKDIQLAKQLAQQLKEQFNDT